PTKRLTSTTSTASSCNPTGKRNPTWLTSDRFKLEKTMISADLLRRIRNDLPMPVTIAALGREGPPLQNERGVLPLRLPTLRRDARHRQPAQQPRPLLLVQTKPQQHRPAPHPRL